MTYRPDVRMHLLRRHDRDLDDLLLDHYLLVHLVPQHLLLRQRRSGYLSARLGYRRPDLDVSVPTALVLSRRPDLDDRHADLNLDDRYRLAFHLGHHDRHSRLGVPSDVVLGYHPVLVCSFPDVC